MLSARGEEQDKIDGLELGADDYVVKPFAIEEVVARLRALLRRGTDRSGLVSVGPLTLDTERHEVRRGEGEPVELTGRESELLEMLMREPRVVISRGAAVERIWGGAAVENVVDRYVARLRRKLDDPKLIRTVWGVGFILEP
jgi:DNA-binding response OmpR family regulator